MILADQSVSKKPRNIFLRLLGPGLVTGAADDDPSGIATYSQAGAQFGYGLLWTVFLTTPFMIAIQLVSARSAGSPVVVQPPISWRLRRAGSCWFSFLFW
jgi:Mn2+/Fe2+ NRAMP family transporter